MLGIGGRFAGAKGMVAVPDLSNLNPDQALAVLSSIGLRRGSLGSSTTNNSGIDNRVFAQSISAGTLVDYESSVDYSYYIYVPPAPDPTPQPYLCGDWYPAERASGYECTGGGYSRPYTEEENRMNYCLGGVPTGAYIVDPNSIRRYYVGTNAQRDGVCGYTTPVVTCTPTFIEVSSWTGVCSGGSQLTATRYRNSCTGEETVVSGSQSCCVSTAIATTSWTGDCINCYRKTAQRYVDSCTGATWVENGSQYCCSAGGGGTYLAV